jgi:hypothetical protein
MIVFFDTASLFGVTDLLFFFSRHCCSRAQVDVRWCCLLLSGDAMLLPAEAEFVSKYLVAFCVSTTFSAPQIVAALRMRGGEAAVLQTLHRARIMHQTGSAPNGGADQLASLFAQCVLAESSSAAGRGPEADQAEAMVQDVNHRPQGMTGSRNAVMQHYMEDCQVRFLVQEGICLKT